ncbi:MAG: hypothetical protein BGO51_20705 [Rhodospirillales bacterium 69-11]|jgi:hypothetical protein|nr:hypothetical protein [Rhodospirillales bacterium]MBN8926263.1 hypothetical protein [Rhodospirillales bacterium]OJW27791.1 MAG: hypothetical protein BGO51_20705 [Rhodospirillales bacterium 69-11]
MRLSHRALIACPTAVAAGSAARARVQTAETAMGTATATIRIGRGVPASAIRTDGRKIQPFHLHGGGTPFDGKEAWNDDEPQAATPADPAIRPGGGGVCPLVTT